MTREETVKIIQIIKVSYPNYKPENLTQTVDAWTMMFEEYTYNQVAMALKSFIMTDTSGFPPAIGQIVGHIQKIAIPNELSETEAWLLVSKALRNSTYHADEEFEKLPPIVQKVVGSPAQLVNWGQTNIESVENVIQSNFMRSYRATVAREKEIARMPAEARTAIEANRDVKLLG